MTDAILAIIDLQAAKGAIAKKKIIENNRDDDYFRDLLYCALHPLMTYNLSEKTLRKARPLFDGGQSYSSIFAICNHLSERRSVDNLTVRYVKGFLETFQKEEEEVSEVTEEPKKADDILLLEEIRDLLKENNKPNKTNKK